MSTARLIDTRRHSFSLERKSALGADLAVCREILRRSRSSFHYAFYLLPREPRDALSAVYAFCRAADDIADAEGVRDPAGRLDAWRREVDRVFAGRPVHAVGRALAWAVDSFALPRAPFVDLIEGVRTDISVRRYETAEELEAYCYAVASTVGLLCVRIFGASRGVADAYAVDLGKAFQLTNILRDLGEDAERGRIYLPAEDLARVGCSQEMILERCPTPEVARLVTFEVARARWLYARAASVLPVDPQVRRALAPAEAMCRIYSALLDRIEETGARVLKVRARLSSLSRVSLAARAWLARGS